MTSFITFFASCFDGMNGAYGSAENIVAESEGITVTLEAELPPEGGFDRYIMS